MKPLNLISGFIFFAFLISCNNNDEAGKVPEIQLGPVDSMSTTQAGNIETLPVDVMLVKKYEDACRTDTIADEKKFFYTLLKIIKQFKGRHPDTTVLTIGNLDGDNEKDTIFTRVYYHADSIHIDSKWIKNKEVLWRHNYTNPYVSFNHELLNYDIINKWAIFSVGVVYGAPDIQSRENFMNYADSVTMQYVYKDGIKDLQRMGIMVKETDYINYIQNFKGDLIAFGEPETREGVWVWYKPAGKMISFFQP